MTDEGELLLVSNTLRISDLGIWLDLRYILARGDKTVAKIVCFAHVLSTYHLPFFLSSHTIPSVLMAKA